MGRKGVGFYRFRGREMAGQWTGFFVPRPSYNKYPDKKSEYDIPGAFDASEPERRWDDPDDYEYGIRWQHTFGKSDVLRSTASARTRPDWTNGSADARSA